MKHIFYFIWILFFLYEIFWLATFRERISNALKSSKWIKENKGRLNEIEWSDWPEEVKSATIYFFLLAVPFNVLKLIGLMTSNWPVFMVWFVFSWAFVIPVGSVLKRWKHVYGLLHVLVALVNMAVILFLVLNAYHFHIDVFAWIGSHLNQ